MSSSEKPTIKKPYEIDTTKNIAEQIIAMENSENGTNFTTLEEINSAHPGRYLFTEDTDNSLKVNEAVTTQAQERAQQLNEQNNLTDTEKKTVLGEQYKYSADGYFDASLDERKTIRTYNNAVNKYGRLEEGEIGSPKEFAILWAMLKLADKEGFFHTEKYVTEIIANRPLGFKTGLRRILEGQKRFHEENETITDFEDKKLTPYLKGMKKLEDLKKLNDGDYNDKRQVVSEYFTDLFKIMNETRAELRKNLAGEKSKEARRNIQDQLALHNKGRKEAERIKSLYETGFEKNKLSEREKIENAIKSYYNKNEDEGARVKHKMGILNKLGLLDDILTENNPKTTAEKTFDAAFDLFSQNFKKSTESTKVKKKTGTKAKADDKKPDTAKKNGDEPDDTTSKEETTSFPVPSFEPTTDSDNEDTESTTPKESYGETLNRLKDELSGSVDDVKLKESRATEKEQLKNKFVGKNIKYEVGGNTETYTIKNIEEAPSGDLAVLLALTNGRGKGMLVVFKKDELGEKLEKQESRGEALSRLTENLSTQLAADLKDMSVLKRAFLQVRKAFGGQKIETGLNENTKESLTAVDDYLDELLDSARIKWQDLGYPSEKIEKLLVRYKSRYMSTLQLRSEYALIEKQKEDGIANTWVGRTAKLLSNKWNGLSPKVRAGIGLAATAGITIGSVLSGTAVTTRLAAIAGGLLGGGVARASLEKEWASSESADKLRSTLEDKQRTYKEYVEEIKKLVKEETEEPDFDKKTEIKEKRDVIEEKLAVIQKDFKTVNEEIEKESGKLNKQRLDLEADYNSHKISASEYLKEDRALRNREIRVNSTKKVMILTAALLGAGASAMAMDPGIFDSMTADNVPDLEDTTPEAEPVEDVSSQPAAEQDPGINFELGDEESIPTNEPITLEPEVEEVVIETEQPVSTETVIEEPTESTTEPEVEETIVETEPQDNEQLRDPQNSTVKRGEGITYAYRDQFDNNSDLLKVYEEKLGMSYEANKPLFLETLAEEFHPADTMVGEADKISYQLNMDGTESEFYDGDFKKQNAFGDIFEKSNIETYEYTDTSTGETSSETSTVDTKVDAVGPNPDGSARNSVSSTGTTGGAVGPNPDGSARVSPDNVLSSPDETPVVESSPTNVSDAKFEASLDKISGSSTEIVKDNLLGEFYEKTADGHWKLPGTDIHYSPTDVSSQEFSTIDDGGSYKPKQNLAKLNASVWFNKMDSGDMTAGPLANVLEVTEGQAKTILASLKEVQMLARNLDINIPSGSDMTIEDIINNIATKVSK